MRAREIAVLLLLLVVGRPASAAVPRGVPPVAEIVTVKGDEQVRFVEEPAWRVAELKQDLATGDALQTGRYGGLAILFRDETQIRVHRNSTLIVKSVRSRGGVGQTELRLDRGAAWSRAKKVVPDQLRLETPAATAGIRGTDWHLRVEDDGRTTLIVLDGEVVFFNDRGSVSVVRGEIAVAEVGQPPTKSILLNPKDRPQWELVLTPDWIRILQITGQPVWDLRAARDRLRERVERDRSGDALIELAELVYELGDAAGARPILEEAARTPEAASPPLRARVSLLAGLLAAHETRFEAADAALEAALPELTDRRRLVALLGRFGVLLAQHRYGPAEELLAGLAPDYEDLPDVHLARVLLVSFRGEQAEAVRLATQGRDRFPEDTRFRAWLAHLYLVLDEPERMREAFTSGLALDPEQEILWHLKGTYHHLVVPDANAALSAYRRALAINPNYAPTWNNLALVLIELADYDAAQAAVRRAIELAPADALYHVTHAALLGVALERLDAGETEARRALQLDPMQSGALLTMGSLALKRGENEEAIDWMLRATVANPGLAGANTSLAGAYYQAGEFEQAERELGNALRLDPHDPLPPLIGSVFAQDQAEAGRAIRYAREAIDRHLGYQSVAIESLANSRSGILSLGSAYTNLGLTDWGESHGQFSFNPGWASSHIFLANQYATPSARRAESVQGLLLDPLAVSARTRYVDLVRQPFHDVTLGASVGAEGGAFAHGQSGAAQGFARIPFPFAYFVGAGRTHSDGFRDNSDLTTETAALGLGIQPTSTQHVLLTADALRARTGLPGPVDHPDPDDRLATDAVSVALGHHYRAGPKNHVLTRLSASYLHERYRNDDPLGTGLSDRSASLVSAFGLEPTRKLYRDGLCNATDVFPAGRPVFFGGSLCPAFGLPLLESDIPTAVDLRTLRELDVEQTGVALQIRHLLEIGSLRLSYGAEGAKTWSRRLARSVGSAPLGTGDALLVDPRPPFPITTFPFGQAVVGRAAEGTEVHAAVGYVGGEWVFGPTAWVEAGLAVSHFDDGGSTETTRVDPRAGLAWRLTTQHAIRLAGQRRLILPIDATLAPVATAGLVVRDELTVPGGSVTAYEGRWDAEWMPRLFTFLSAEERRIDRFVAPIRQSIETVTVEKARLRSLTAGANAWLDEQWGVFARYRLVDSESLAKDESRGHNLPLVPRHAFEAGVTWIHPRQIRVSASGAYVGERAADPANTSRLSGYWTANLSASWQPLRKHLAVTLLLQNLFDVDIELARGYRAPGRIATLSVEYRF